MFNERSGPVFAVALISQKPFADFPLTLELAARGLLKRSWMKLGQIRILSTEPIGRRRGGVSAEEVARVVEGLHEIIG